MAQKITEVVFPLGATVDRGTCICVASYFSGNNNQQPILPQQVKICLQNKAQIGRFV